MKRSARKEKSEDEEYENDDNDNDNDNNNDSEYDNDNGRHDTNGHRGHGGNVVENSHGRVGEGRGNNGDRKRLERCIHGNGRNGVHYYELPPLQKKYGESSNNNNNNINNEDNGHSNHNSNDNNDGTVSMKSEESWATNDSSNDIPLLLQLPRLSGLFGSFHPGFPQTTSKVEWRGMSDFHENHLFAPMTVPTTSAIITAIEVADASVQENEDGKGDEWREQRANAKNRKKESE
ncbi:hypothetical protein RFI_07737 [Reticulomyxa filosa]|uniref:Uncharacterized protein n=1 Tax=Reticulomyxa filosa TaxID=46433 RepID=X6NUD6_RETFI|nr:hypothetical protein RFI_07737 [Reticulomyxa filosa]|eukprot:ETO29384.1 hypothetical protein RFI_07737 [Reticulomyxa filosa]